MKSALAMFGGLVVLLEESLHLQNRAVGLLPSIPVYIFDAVSLAEAVNSQFYWVYPWEFACPLCLRGFSLGS